MSPENSYDILVIGAGHAGCEAALAAARMGLSTAIFTMHRDTIGQMSCNPAIGGLAKSHLVKEIDALGGEMAKVTDKAGIQFKVLNRSKGPAVWATRVQADRALYRRHMRESLELQDGLDIKQEHVEEIIVQDERIQGIGTDLCTYAARAVVIASGTFLNGLIHVGLENYHAGRAGEPPSINLAESLHSLGLKIGRLKTGTPPRIDQKSIDFSVMDIQDGDTPPPPMSLFTEKITNPQLPCYMTYTNSMTHDIIRENLKYSPLYGGVIEGVGARYCPSIEDKIVKFSDKPRHQIFLEPEGLDNDEYYANGISTSLPKDAQDKLVQSIRGLEHAVIRKYGYAIEYDFVFPTQLKPTLETKKISGLYLAGQINGTSGYEEAGAQGLLSGINAALKIKGQPPFILGRHEAYAGVLIDDLVTKGTQEPYRMFTSRAEYRLLLRQDNADLRLLEKGYRLGLIQKSAYHAFTEKKKVIEKELQRIKAARVKPDLINPVLMNHASTPVAEDITFHKLLKRPELDYRSLAEVSPSGNGMTADEITQVEIQTKYEGYIRRQVELADKFTRIEGREIPADFTYAGISGLSREITEKLEEIRPLSLGQASRIPGVTPAAVSALMIALARHSGR